MIEILGWVATSAGAILWLIYALLKSDYPLIAVNTAVLFVHGYWFISNYKTWKN
jgi:hypothetical protein